jgi:hypothetical protein
MNKKKKNLINIQMKNCSTKNFTNKIKTYLDFKQKYKILKKHTSFYILYKRERDYISILYNSKHLKKQMNKNKK